MARPAFFMPFTFRFADFDREGFRALVDFFFLPFFIVRLTDFFPLALRLAADRPARFVAFLRFFAIVLPSSPALTHESRRYVPLALPLA